MMFFWCLLTGGLAVLMSNAVREGGEQVLGILVFGAVALLIGSVFALLFGGFFGFMFSLLEVGLLKIARSLASVS